MPTRSQTAPVARALAAALLAGVALAPATAGAVVTEEKQAGEAEVPSVEVDIPGPPPRTWFQSHPPGFGSFGLGAFFLGYWNDVGLASETETVTIGNQPPVTANLTSAGRAFNADAHGAGIEAVMGLPGLPVLRDVRAHPALSLGVGAMSTTIGSTSPVAPATDFTMSGHGSILGTGIGLVLADPGFPLYFDLDYDYRWQWSTLERQPCSFPPVLSCASEIDSDLQGHWLTAALGWSESRVGAYAGVGYMHGTWQNDITIQRLVQFPTTPTPTVLPVRNQISQELTRDTVEGVVGLDGRWGRFFARAETRFTGSDVSGSVSLSTIFGGGL